MISFKEYIEKKKKKKVIEYQVLSWASSHTEQRNLTKQKENKKDVK